MVAEASRRLTAKASVHSSKSRFNSESLVMLSQTKGNSRFPKILLGRRFSLGTQHSA